jgi:hypothetical protein
MTSDIEAHGGTARGGKESVDVVASVGMVISMNDCTMPRRAAPSGRDGIGNTVDR